MKVLWITNTMLPDLSNKMGRGEVIYGGWMHELARVLSELDHINLTVVTIYDGTDLVEVKINMIQYYLIPSQQRFKVSTRQQLFWKEVVGLVNPNIIHIHGTELSLGLNCIQACPSQNYVASVQGLLSVYHKYYFAALSTSDILFNLSIKDLLLRDSIFHGYSKFKKRSKIELLYFERISNFIGRTEWDYSHVISIAPNSTYYRCNETLRLKFYNSTKWDLESCDKFTIFVSQAGYPIKGLHILLKAICLLKKEFPLIRIFVGGSKMNSTSRLFGRNYDLILKSMLNEFQLEKDVIYCGVLNENMMIERYLRSHVFVCPSSIENSANSIAEAQILGVPVIASYVGGVSDMITDNITGLLYRFEEYEMLADKLRKIFQDDVIAKELSYNAISEAEKRHNREIINKNLISIYSDITNKNCSR